MERVRRRLPRALLLFAAAALVAVPVVGAAAATADGELPPVATSSSDLSTTTTTAAVARIPKEAVDAAIRLGQTTEELMKVEADLADVQIRESALTDELTRLDDQLTENRTALDALEQQVQGRAAEVYVQGGSAPLAPLRIASPQDLQSGRRYASAANAVDGTLVDRLEQVRRELEQDRARKVEARDEISEGRRVLVESRARLVSLRLEQQMLIDTWGVVTVMGPSQLTPAQIAAFYASTGVKPNLPAGITIADLAALFVDEGNLAGVRGDIAFAQSMIETGSFTEFQGNNFSGIGVCDSCTGGYLFDAAREGVRAQMQLLRSYADPTSRATDFTVPLAPVLYGTDPVEGARRFDTFFKKGSAPVWNEMGGGNWATDPNYSGKVLRMYSRMLAFARGDSPAGIERLRQE